MTQQSLFELHSFTVSMLSECESQTIDFMHKQEPAIAKAARFRQICDRHTAIYEAIRKLQRGQARDDFERRTDRRLRLVG